MNIITSAQKSFISLKHHALFVMFICYLPHISTEPWWLFTIFLAAIAYRLLADHFSYQPIPRWMNFVFVVGFLFLLNQDVNSSQFLIRFLLVFIILKSCLELSTVRDLKVIILCNFFLMFSALIVIQQIWMIIYLLIAILANLSIMLKLSAPQVSFKEISSKTSQQLLIVIPISIVLFYVFPRIDPLWQVPALTKGSIGFNETMRFGSISELFNDDSTALQISFKNQPILDGYWQGIILNYYSGESWSASGKNSFLPLQAMKNNEQADYEILLEPTQTKWLFYEGYPVSSRPTLIFSPGRGLNNLKQENMTQRFAYSLKVQPAPYHALNSIEYAAATQLPLNLNPRLNTWAKEQFAKNNLNIPIFIAFLRDYIQQHPFWYTLSPPTLSTTKNQMDQFWFETQKGFCEHYVSAVTFILRAAGIPAHVVVGFHGGRWNPISRTIILQRNDAHAWLEYWQEGIGWQKLDPTAFIAPERIDSTIQNRQTDLFNQKNYFDISKISWVKKIKFIFDSVRFYTDRWFLFYNQSSQKNLLLNIGLEKWKKDQLLQAAVGCMILFFILLGFMYQWRQRKTRDPLLLEYQLLQKEFRRFNVSIPTSATLKQQCKSLINNMPNLSSYVSSFINKYEQLRLKQSNENKRETIALFKIFRNSLRRVKLKQLKQPYDR